MDEGEIRMQAQMYALVAEMNAIMAEVEGMKAANRDGHTCYGEASFTQAATELQAIAEKLKSDI